MLELAISTLVLSFTTTIEQLFSTTVAPIHFTVKEKFFEDKHPKNLGSVIRLQDQVLFMGFLNRQFCLVEAGADQYKDPTKDSGPTSANFEANIQNKVSFSETISSNEFRF